MAYTLDSLGPAALAIVDAAIVIGIGATITSELSTDLTGTAQDAVNNGTSAMDKVGKRLPLIGTIVGLAIVLGVVFSALYIRS